MYIYLDVIFFLNLWIDFLLIITTNLILKYKISYKKVFLASFVGACSTFTIFIKNDILLFLAKILFCVIIQIIANGFKGMHTLLENIFYFYLISIILSGTFYLLKIDEISIIEKYTLLFIFTPIILYINKKQIKKLDNYYKDIYDVIIVYKNKKYFFNALLDTGNNLYDQYKKRPISIVYSNKLKFDYENGLLVPIETANEKSILKCIKVDKIIVDNKEIINPIIGLSNRKINIQDINMILHKDIIGGKK